MCICTVKLEETEITRKSHFTANESKMSVHSGSKLEQFVQQHSLGLISKRVQEQLEQRLEGQTKQVFT